MPERTRAWKITAMYEFLEAACNGFTAGCGTDGGMREKGNNPLAASSENCTYVGLRIRRMQGFQRKYGDYGIQMCSFTHQAHSHTLSNTHSLKHINTANSSCLLISGVTAFSPALRRGFFQTAAFQGILQTRHSYTYASFARRQKKHHICGYCSGG
jgi:hypothetical protein